MYAPVQEDEVRKDEEIIASSSSEECQKLSFREVKFPLQKTNFVLVVLISIGWTKSHSTQTEVASAALLVDFKLKEFLWSMVFDDGSSK